MELIDSKAFVAFVEDIKTRIKAAQYRALQVVNKEHIQLYWDIGQMIVERQEQHGWGKSIVEKLSIELQDEFVGMNGFSARNLWRMRALYTEYSQSTICLARHSEAYRGSDLHLDRIFTQGISSIFSK